jgi:5'-phosphate synthase pdxT subunit
MDLPFLAGSGSETKPAPFPGVFIRAPVVEALLEGDMKTTVSTVEVMAVLPGRTSRATGAAVVQSSSTEGDASDIVAVRQGNIFGTSFHPELTDDVRIHVWWLEQVIERLRTKIAA